MNSFNGFILPKPDRKRGGGLWMNDWSAYQTVYDYSASTTSLAASNTRTIVDVTGEGYVLFMRPFSTTFQAELPPLILTIDGIAYNFDGASVPGSSVYSQQGNLVAHPIYFRNQLKIQVRNKHTAAAQIGCDYLYLLKSSEPNPRKQTYLESGSRLSAFAIGTASTYSTVASVTGSGYILSIFGEAYGTTNGAHLGALTIDGQSKYTGRTMATIHTGARSGLLLGPIRFNSSFHVQHMIDVGPTAFTRVMYTLD